MQNESTKGKLFNLIGVTLTLHEKTQPMQYFLICNEVGKFQLMNRLVNSTTHTTVSFAHHQRRQRQGPNGISLGLDGTFDGSLTFERVIRQFPGKGPLIYTVMGGTVVFEKFVIL